MNPNAQNMKALAACPKHDRVVIGAKLRLHIGIAKVRRPFENLASRQGFPIRVDPGEFGIEKLIQGRLVRARERLDESMVRLNRGGVVAALAERQGGTRQ